MRNIFCLQPLQENDKAVRNSFTDIISNFVRSGGNKDKKENNGLFSSFKSDGESFIKIGKEVTFDKNFRYCNSIYSTFAIRITIIFQSVECVSSHFLELQLNRLGHQRAHFWLMNCLVSTKQHQT